MEIRRSENLVDTCGQTDGCSWTKLINAFCDCVNAPEKYCPFRNQGALDKIVGLLVLSLLSVNIWCNMKLQRPSVRYLTILD